MPELAIEITSVGKRFGNRAVLDGLNLNVPAGKTYAFLGRNGAGKTTTIRMLMGLLKPDAGTIRVLGIDPVKNAMAIRQQVGYLAEDQQMWGWMKIREILKFIAAFYPTWDWALARTLLEKFALPSEGKVKHLSKGQNVRLGLLLALAHRPRLMILDDPALGLDPIMRKDFLRDIVEHLQGDDVTVFFSSHLLYEVEPVADVVGILDHGALVREAGTEELRETVQRVTFGTEDWERTRAEIHGVSRILDVRPEARQVAVTFENAPAAVEGLRKVGLDARGEGLNLDDIFEAYVAGKPNTPIRVVPAVV